MDLKEERKLVEQKVLEILKCNVETIDTNLFYKKLKETKKAMSDLHKREIQERIFNGLIVSLLELNDPKYELDFDLKKSNYL